ncbi:MAG: ATPase [Bacillota bacterium]|nr:ATPase [Bacillota bacterium]
MSEIAVKALAAALTILGCSWATAVVQMRVGSAGAGTIAERPETAGMVIALEAIPETIVVLGFVVAAMIVTTLK